jgi:hypothetical protein
MYIGYSTLALASALVTMIVNAHSTPSLSYRLQDSIIGYDFLDAFMWETKDDPTHGRVNYVDKATALKDNLTFGVHLLVLFFAIEFQSSASFRLQIRHAR